MRRRRVPWRFCSPNRSLICRLSSKVYRRIIIAFGRPITTLIYYYTVSSLGNPTGNIDSGGTFGSYIGLLFLGGAFVSIGLFASSLTDNQIVSFLLAMFLCFFVFYGFDQIAGFELFGSADLFILKLGINEHYVSMSRGVIDSRDLLYFISVIALFIGATQLVIQSRKW